MIEFNSKVIAKTLKKVCSGEPITNNEINVTIEHLQPVVNLIGSLDRKYYLMWKELSDSLRVLKDYRLARKNFKEKYGFEIID
jgi:hypothetical protein